MDDLLATHPAAKYAKVVDNKIHLFVTDLNITCAARVPKKFNGMLVVGKLAPSKHSVTETLEYLPQQLLTVEELLRLKDVYLANECYIRENPDILVSKLSYKITRGFYDATKPCICFGIQTKKTDNIPDENKIPPIMFDQKGNFCFTDVEEVMQISDSDEKK